jgi:hypothetical protein
MTALQAQAGASSGAHEDRLRAVHLHLGGRI